MKIAKTAVDTNECIQDPQVTDGLATMIERIAVSLGAIENLLRHQILKDSRSFDDATKKVEIKWNVWLLREGKVKEMVATLTQTKQSVASTLAAITTVSTYEGQHIASGNMADHFVGW